MGCTKSKSLEAATRKARADQRREALYIQAIGVQCDYRSGRTVPDYDSMSSREQILRKEERVYSRDILTPSERWAVEVLGLENRLADVPHRPRNNSAYVPVYTADGVRHVVRGDRVAEFLAKNPESVVKEVEL